MKLNKKQIAKIENIIKNLERANDFLMGESIAISRRCNMATTTLHYSRNDGKCLYEIEKSYGSDLTGLFNGIESLKNFLYDGLN